MDGDVTKLLNAMGHGDAVASDHLLRAVYDELRQLAAQKLSHEKPGHTLEATALVHEAYLRLGAAGQTWENRRHFFAAAAEAMRRILVESARRRRAAKRGGGRARHDVDSVPIAVPQLSDDILALDEALERLETIDEQAARVVKCRYYAGLTIPQTAEALQISPRTADRLWAFARAWLFQEINGNPSPRS
jgi:RNA polymerase sigma factor (TIGR02999 family)